MSKWWTKSAEEASSHLLWLQTQTNKAWCNRLSRGQVCRSRQQCSFPFRRLYYWSEWRSNCEFYPIVSVFVFTAVLSRNRRALDTPPISFRVESIVFFGIVTSMFIGSRFTIQKSGRGDMGGPAPAIPLSCIWNTWGDYKHSSEQDIRKSYWPRR